MNSPATGDGYDVCMRLFEIGAAEFVLGADQAILSMGLDPLKLDVGESNLSGAQDNRQGQQSMVLPKAASNGHPVLNFF